MREVLKFAAVLVIVGGAAFGFISLQERKGYGLKEGSPAPGFQLRSLGGAGGDLGALRGRVVLVNFWATWCAPCKMEIPWMIEFQKKYSSRGFTILGVSMDEEGKKVVAPFLDKERFDVDGQKVAEGHVPKTQPFAFSADEGADVGMDNETPVSNDYKEGDNKFTGKIKKITIDIKPANLTAKVMEDINQKEKLAKLAED